MLSRLFSALGQAFVVTVGAGYGIAASLARPANSGGRAQTLTVPAQSPYSEAFRSIDLRLSAIEARVSDLESSRVGVSMADLEKSTQELARTLRAEIDEKFAAQDASVQALKVLVGQTAELVEKAVEKLERV